MVKPSIEPGTELDGFTIGECVHRGGMATLWTVTHPGIIVPLLMKIPRVSEGEDPAVRPPRSAVASVQGGRDDRKPKAIEA